MSRVRTTSKETTRIEGLAIAPTQPCAPFSSPGAGGDLPVLAGRYQLLSLLGAGGMGTVYRARDLELDEVVALKLLRSELRDEGELVERFRQEVKLARRITHPNVVRTYDIGAEGSSRFLTMEYVEGESLAARLRRDGPLPVAQAVEIALAICEALAAAHAAGIVHRDLKPDNVLLADDGRVVLTDFGLALAVEAAPAGSVRAGTPAYMAPEQVEGTVQMDARTDLYALGVVLYEMVTGKRPWRGVSGYEEASQRLSSPPPDPRNLRPDAPYALGRIILRCMARAPVDRFAGARDVSRALRAIAARGRLLGGGRKEGPRKAA